MRPKQKLDGNLLAFTGAIQEKFTGVKDCKLYMLDLTSGKVKWTLATSQPVTTIVSAGPVLRAVSHFPQGTAVGGSYLEIDAATGKKRLEKRKSVSASAYSLDLKYALGWVSPYYAPNATKAIRIDFPSMKVSRLLQDDRSFMLPSQLTQNPVLICMPRNLVKGNQAAFDPAQKPVLVASNGAKQSFENGFTFQVKSGFVVAKGPYVKGKGTVCQLWSTNNLKKVREFVMPDYGDGRPILLEVLSDKSQAVVSWQLGDSYQRASKTRRRCVFIIPFDPSNPIADGLSTFTAPHNYRARNEPTELDLCVPDLQGVLSGRLAPDAALQPITKLSEKHKRVLASETSADGKLMYAVLSDRPRNTGPGNLTLLVKDMESGDLIFEDDLGKQSTSTPRIDVLESGEVLIIDRDRVRCYASN